MSSDVHMYLTEVCAIARAAGARILEVRERGYSVARKHDESPLTEADRAAHELICARLAALTPAIPVLSEESAESGYAGRAGWKQFWLVDPLDGTKEFISGSGEFTVNIALIEDTRPILGVVHIPARAETYSACRGGAAFLERAGAAPAAIQARRYTGGRATVAASRSHVSQQDLAFLQSLGAHDTLTMGSSIKFCLVAAGMADVYARLGPTMEWDTAAAQCVVEAAGGHVVDVDGRPLSYNKPDLHNPWFIASGAGDYDWAQHVASAA